MIRGALIAGARLTSRGHLLALTLIPPRLQVTKPGSICRRVGGVNRGAGREIRRFVCRVRFEKCAHRAPTPRRQDPPSEWFL